MDSLFVSISFLTERKYKNFEGVHRYLDLSISILEPYACQACTRRFRFYSVQLQHLGPRDISQVMKEGKNHPSFMTRLMLVGPVEVLPLFL
jgi:hypothetical protein